MMSNTAEEQKTALKKATRIGSAAAITMVGGTIFVDGQPVSAASIVVSNPNAAGAGSLSQAIDDANATAEADTITFLPSVSGPIQIGATTLDVKYDLTIIGPGSDLLTIENYAGFNLVYVYNDASLTVSGLTLNDAGEDAIAVNNTADTSVLSLTDVVIDDAFDDGIDAFHTGTITLTDTIITRSGESGVEGYYAGDVTITDSTLAFNGDYGAYFDQIGDLTVTRSNFSGNGDSGLNADDADGDVSVTFSTFANNYDVNLYLDNVYNGGVTITDSTFVGSRTGIYVEYVEYDTVIERVTVADSRGDAIYLEDLQGDLTMRDVTVTNSYDYAIQVDYVGGDVLMERVTVDVTGDGVYLGDIAGNATVRDVTVSNSFDDSALEIDDVDGNVLVERVTIRDSYEGLYIDSAGDAATDTVIVRNIDVSDVHSGQGIIVDNPYDGVAVTIQDITMTNVADDTAIEVDEVDGEVLIERVTMDRVYEGIEVDFDDPPSAGGVTIRDITATNVEDDAAIEVDDPFGETLIESVVVDFAYRGIDVNDPRMDVTIRNVSIEDTFDGQAIEVRDNVAPPPNAPNVLIEDAVLIDVYDGIEVFGVDGDTTVQRVSITDTFNAPVYIRQNVGDVTVTDVNIVGALDDEGIGIESDGFVTVQNVTIEGVVEDSAIQINEAALGLSMSNVTIGAGGGGLDLDDLDGPSTITDVTVGPVYDSTVELSNSSGAIVFQRVTGAGTIHSDAFNVTSQTGDLTLRDVEMVDAGDGNNALEVVSTANVTIQRSTFAGAKDVGVDIRNAPNVSIENSTIVDNRTDDTDDGAAIELDNVANASISHSTIAGNGADPADAGVAAIRLENTTTLTIDHSIVTANDGLALYSDDASGNTITVTDSMVPVGTGLAGTTIENDDPELGPLQDNGGPTMTAKPLPGSPAIDAGNPAFAPPPANDQRGGLRVVGSAIDLGSVEVSAGVVDMGSATLTVAEDAGSIDIPIVRSGGQDGPGSVTVTLTSGSATAGDDFTAAPVVVNFADNQLTAVATVPILSDDLVEGDETFTATLSAATGVTLGSSTSTAVTITDVVVASPDALSVLAPKRYADTRGSGVTFDGVAQATGRLGAGGQLVVPIAGRGGVPADAVGVIMNVTAVNPGTNGFVTAHACLSPVPNTSSLNYTAGVNLGNEVVAALDGSGNVCLNTSSAADLTVDVVGFVSASSPLVTVTPARLMDNRPSGVTVDGQAQGGGKTTAGGQVTLAVAGRAGVPADAAAVIVNVTAVNPGGNGFVTVHPCVSPAPTASSLNHVAGVNRGNELVASLDASGNICLLTSASINLTVDVVAYLPAGTNVNSVTPARLLDTRTTGSTVDGQSQGAGKLSGGSQVTLQATGRAGVPAGAKAVVLNVTAVAPEGVGFVTVHPCLSPRPLSSALNYVAGVNGGNEIVAPLNAAGQVCLFTSAGAHLTADVVAYLD